jgi:outer membrane protein
MRHLATGLIVILSVIIYLGPAFAQRKRLLTLDEAVKTALENNPGITISEADVQSSEALVRIAKDTYYPQIYTRLIFPFVGRESGFFLDQRIWDFGRTTNKIKSSKAQLESNKFSKEKTKDDVELNTIVSYYTVLSQMRITEAAEKKEIEAQKRFEQAEAFYKAGRISQIDVTKEEVNLGNSQLELATAKNNLVIASDNLMNAMGLKGEFNFELEDSLEYKKPDVNLEESIDRAVESRPEIKSLEAQEVAMKADLEAAKKEFYPLLFGTTAYRFRGKGATTPGFIAGIGMQFPIFEGFSRFAGIQDAQAKLLRAQAQILTAKAEIEKEVKQLKLDLDLAGENIHVTGKTRESAERSLHLAQERYRLGRASELELAEAEAIYSSSDSAYKQAIYNYNITAARLKRAIGDIDDTDK